MSYRPMRALINVGGKQRAGRLIQLHSSRREQHLAHSAAAAPRGDMAKPRQKGGGAVAKLRAGGGGERPATATNQPDS
jgi:hypothetical protein